MSIDPGAIPTNRSPKLPVFLRVFFALFFLSVAASVLISYALPETFASRTRVKVSNTDPGYDPHLIQEALKFLASDAVLSRAVDELRMQEESTSTHKRTGTAEDITVESVRRRIKAEPVRNATLVELTAFGNRPSEASRLANVVAQAAVTMAGQAENETAPDVRFLVLDAAVSESRPVYPNKPLNMLLGALIGALIGALGGGAIVSLRRRIEDRQLAGG